MKEAAHCNGGAGAARRPYYGTPSAALPDRLNTYLHHQPSVRPPHNDRSQTQDQLQALADFGIDLAILEQNLQLESSANLRAGFTRLKNILVKRDQLAVM